MWRHVSLKKQSEDKAGNYGWVYPLQTEDYIYLLRSDEGLNYLTCHKDFFHCIKTERKRDSVSQKNIINIRNQWLHISQARKVNVCI